MAYAKIRRAIQAQKGLPVTDDVLDKTQKLAQLRSQSEQSKKIGWVVVGALFVGGIYLGWGTAWALGVGGLWVSFWYGKYWPVVGSLDTSPSSLLLVCAVLSVAKCSSAVDTRDKLSYIEKTCARELAGREDDLNHVCARINGKIHQPGILGVSGDDN